MLVSGQRLDLVPLNFQQRWAFDQGNALRLTGAHGQEIVRTLCINEKVGLHELIILVHV